MEHQRCVVPRTYGEGGSAEFAKTCSRSTSSSRSSTRALRAAAATQLLDELAPGGAHASWHRSRKISPTRRRRRPGCAILPGRDRPRVAVDARARGSVARVAAVISRSLRDGRGISRAMIVGIPNSGKSSIVNALLRRAAAKTERPCRRHAPSPMVSSRTERRADGYARRSAARRFRGAAGAMEARASAARYRATITIRKKSRPHFHEWLAQRKPAHAACRISESICGAARLRSTRRRDRLSQRRAVLHPRIQRRRVRPHLIGGSR